MVATWIVKKDWLITKLVAGTAITAAKWGLTYVPDCAVTNATTAVAACGTATWGAAKSTTTMGGNWW